MPRSTVTTKENDVVMILLCQVAQEEIHTNSITVWHDQETTLPCSRLDSSIDITIFPDVMARDRWTNTLWTPAELGVVDPSKARFILEHQAHFPTGSTAIVDIFSNSHTFSLIFLRTL